MTAAANSVTVHATAVYLGGAVRQFGAVEGMAVLLIGGSGSGKSDVALRLIAEGGTLISDDQTLLSTDGERLFAESVDTIEGKMEIRGIGIISVPHMAKAPIALVVQLAPGAATERLPEPSCYSPPPPLKASRLPPIAVLDPLQPAITAKITAAAATAATGRFVAGVAP